MGKHSNDRLQGTLDLLILNVLRHGGAMHGYAIAQRIRQATDNGIRVEDGSLYPALHRMTNDGWLRAKWGVTQTRRKARLYSITGTGRTQLGEEEHQWNLLTRAVGKALRFA
jgi:PadR family transcriptional regulator, regulatory protein PadR